jgi:hypothetical protein
MLDLLRECITKDAFDACWAVPPPYDSFIVVVAEKISDSSDDQVTAITCSARSNGDNRIRLDGVVVTSTVSHSVYVNIVWMPKTKNFRGTASLRPITNRDIGEGSSDDELVPVFIPPLGNLLAEIECNNKIPLTEAEVLAIRDKATVIALRRSAAAEMDERRGYRDIDPANCWEEWLELRMKLKNS